MNRGESSITEENTVEYLKKGYELYTKNGNSKHYRLYLPLYREHRTLAQTFFLTNYDINLINSYFLREWFHYRIGASIPLRIVMTHISPKHFSLMKLFFDKNNEVTQKQYFIFVCSFLFFWPSQIMNLMISMAKVTSKLFITKNQIFSFFQCYGFTPDQFPKLIEELETHNSNTNTNNNNNNNSRRRSSDNNNNNKSSSQQQQQSSSSLSSRKNYSLKVFCKCIQESNIFLEYINSLRESLLNFALSRIIYNNINKRIYFYYRNGINKIVPPKEPCTSFIVRILVTNAPPPYHYDYCLENDQLEGGFDKAVMVIKRIYDDKHNSLASISSTRRLHTSSCRSNRVMSSSCSKSSRAKTELSINMKSSKIVPFTLHPMSP